MAELLVQSILSLSVMSGRSSMISPPDRLAASSFDETTQMLAFPHLSGEGLIGLRRELVTSVLCC